MIDIHSHILPGVDDGPVHIDLSVAMAQEAVKFGVCTLFATPHAFHPAFDVTPDDRDKSLAIFRTELQRLNIPLSVLPGFECSIVADLGRRIADDARYLLPEDAALGPGRHVLVELDDGLPVACLQSLLFNCQMMGFSLILAHPERCREVQQNPEALAPFIHNGGKVQITARSLMGNRRCPKRRASEFLLKHALVSFLASDAHCIEDITCFGEALSRTRRMAGPQAVKT